MADTKRTASKASKQDEAPQPLESNARAESVLDPVQLDGLRNKRHEANRLGRAGEVVHLDNLIREAEARQQGRDDAKASS